MDNKKDLTAVRKAANKTQKYKTVITVIGVMLFIARMLSTGVNSGILTLAIIVSAVVYVILMVKGAKAEVEYHETVVNDIITPVIQERFPSIKYSLDVPKQYIDPILKKYRDAKMFISDSDKDMQNYITSDVNNLEIVSLETSHTSRDDDGHSSTVISFKGTLVSFNTEINIPDNCVVKVTCSTQGLIAERTFVPFTFRDDAKRHHTIDVNNPDFDKYFQVYADSEHSAMYVLNPYVVEKLMSLRQRYNKYSIYISKHQILVSLGTFDAFISIPDSKTKFDNTIFDKFGERLQYMTNFLNDVAYAISSSTKVNSIF